MPVGSIISYEIVIRAHYYVSGMPSRPAGTACRHSAISYDRTLVKRKYKIKLRILYPSPISNTFGNILRFFQCPSNFNQMSTLKAN